MDNDPVKREFGSARKSKSSLGQKERQYILKNITDKVKTNYDYIIMDCPPSLNMLTINALTAATSVLASDSSANNYPLEGLSQLVHTIDLVKDRLNKKDFRHGRR